MDPTRFQHLMELQRSGHLHEVIRESQALLKDATDDNEKASLLTIMHVSYCKLDHLVAAKEALEKIKRLGISDIGIRLNAEFCEPAFLLQQGRHEEGLAAFAAMLERNREALKEAEHRYLYEDIQVRRALTLFGLSRCKEALPILREASLFSFSQPIDEQQVHFALGVCLDNANEPEGSKEEFARVVSLAMRNDVEEQALYRLAMLHYKNGALAQARQQLETILRNFPSDSAAVPRRGVYEGLSQTCRYLGDEANSRLYMDLAKRESASVQRRSPKV